MSTLSRLGLRAPNYDKTPALPVPKPFAGDFWGGWEAIAAKLSHRKNEGIRTVIAVECYTGVFGEEIGNEIAARIPSATTLFTEQAFKSADQVEQLVAPFLGGDDPIFGFLNQTLHLGDFFDPVRLEKMASLVWGETLKNKVILVVGPGASVLIPEADLLVYADMPRWEEQLRQRRGLSENLGARNEGAKPSLQYKRSYFVDWRVVDRHKKATMPKWDFVLDTTKPAEPKMTTGDAYRAALEHATTRPFRVVPFFDPGPWGGQWMREVCGLPEGPPNFAWCFDCVPEENSLLLAFADGALETPSQNLVFARPEGLLGEPVYGRFGAEFPIRFDFLDTMGGGNLSFQVHPTVDYAREHFGLSYTQDESYYLLDASQGALVYLGCKDGTKPLEMISELKAAQAGGNPFNASRFAASFPARRHDHFLIPAGTLHCSGANSMVLEISATPYIFTFKLWDWARLGLDGKPRPLNIDRGAEVIRWDRDETYAKEHLVNQFEPVAEGPGWREERTGLHRAEFIETRRHWFTETVLHDTGGRKAGGVNVLNLIQGDEAVVESPEGAFPPFVVHYAETFIVPAAVGPYTIRPAGKTAGVEFATIKAFVRTRP